MGGGTAALFSPTSPAKGSGRLKYKLVGRSCRKTRFRSIRPAAAISLSLCFMLATGHMPWCFQSRRLVTAFSSPNGSTLSRSPAMGMRNACRFYVGSSSTMYGTRFLNKSSA